MEKLFLLDGHSLAHRSFYALPLLTNESGEYTNSVFGFVRMLFKIIDDEKPDHIAVAFDLKGPTFRHEEYEDYKAGRKKTADELIPQIDLIKDVLRFLNIPIITKKGYEADDVIGTMAKEAAQKNINVKIVTGDRDALQLIDEYINVIYTRKGITDIVEYDIEKVKEKYELRPDQLIDMKGLMGDSSDNIPGVPGIGEKTSIKLLKEFDSRENVLENIDKVSGKKRKENLRKYSEQAKMSKKLGKIVTDVSIDLDFEELKLDEPNFEEVIELFKRLEFNSLLDRFEDEIEEKLKEISYNSVESNKDVNIVLEKIKKSNKFAFAFDQDEDELLLKTDDQIYKFKPFAEYVNKFKNVFENNDIKKISFNSKENILYLIENNIECKGLKFDPQLASYLLNPDESPLKMKNMLMREFNVSKDEIESSQDQKAQFLNYLFDLKDIYIKKLEDKDLLELYYNIELPLIKVLAQMETNGIYADCEFLEDFSQKIADKIKDIEEKTYELAGEEFNLNSPKQLGEILFDKLELPVIKKTKTGYTTNAEVLDKLKDKHPIINKVIEYRQLSKLNSTYVDGFVKLIDKEDGRVHSSFKQTIASTGRISSTEPNLQNIPVRTEEGRELRKVFVAEDKDYILLDADYSQIELRVLAHVANENKLIESFKKGEDIHTKTAAEVFKEPIDEVSSIMRGRAKAVNFGIVYGISDYGLSRDLNITRKEAKTYIDNYLANYEKVKAYMKEIIKKGKNDGYVDTVFGRRRYLPELKSRNYNVRSFGERLALNTPIQGNAADIIKKAMINVYERLEDEGLKSRLILQVHDELIIEAYKPELENVKSILKEEMENAAKLKVKLAVDMNTGVSWYEAK